MSATDETPSTQPETAPTPRSQRRVARFVVRSLAVLLVVVGTTLATTWWWAGTPGSAAQAVGWAVRWMEKRADTVGTLRTEGVEGSVRGGVRVAALDWHRGALAVHAEGVVLQWDDALWLGLLRGLGAHPSSAHMRLLRITDTREPTPTEPLERLVLPLPVSLAFSVDRFERIGTDASPFTLSGIRGHYRYGLLSPSAQSHALPALSGLGLAHQLRVDALQLADGHYRGELTLGAEAPMPLALDLQGALPTRVPEGEALSLAVRAKLRGSRSVECATQPLQRRHGRSSLLAGPRARRRGRCRPGRSGRRAARGRAAAGGRAGQAPTRRGRHRLGAGRHRRRARR